MVAKPKGAAVPHSGPSDPTATATSPSPPASTASTTTTTNPTGQQPSGDNDNR